NNLRIINKPKFSFLHGDLYLCGHMKGFRVLLPVLLLFFAMLLLIIFCKDWLVKINVNPAVVRAGNLLMAILTIITIAIQHRALQNSNPNVFIRSVMSTMLIKMLVIALSLIIY